MTTQSWSPARCAQRCRYYCPAHYQSHQYCTKSERPIPQGTYTSLSTRRLISLRGPDAVSFLQGAITANITHVADQSTGGFYAAFLNPKGRVLNDVFIYKDLAGSSQKPDTSGESWLIDVGARGAEQLTAHIKKYKLRARFRVNLYDKSERNVWACWTHETGDVWTEHRIGVKKGENIGLRDILVGCRDTRAPGMGTRVVLDHGARVEDHLTGQSTTEEMYKVRRYLKGVPEGQDEILSGEALPQESNIDFMGGIDYRKGCYVGQELTIRTHHTGVVRRRILPLMLYTNDSLPSKLEYKPGSFEAEQIPIGTKISKMDKEGRAPAKWLAGIGNIGLGLCRLDAMTDVKVPGDINNHQEGDEFKVDWQREVGEAQVVKVKAFVPSWHPTQQVHS